MTAEISLDESAGTGVEVHAERVARCVRLLVARLTHREPAALNDDDRLYADLGLQSVAVLELLTTLERELGVDVRPADLEPGHLETIGSLTAYLTGI